MWIVSGCEKPLFGCPVTVACTCSCTPYPPPPKPSTGTVGSAGARLTTIDCWNAPNGQFTSEIPSAAETAPGADTLTSGRGDGTAGTGDADTVPTTAASTKFE